ncbi:MAG: AtpZ/AtpI family protein [Bacteroidota bacterium]
MAPKQPHTEDTDKKKKTAARNYMKYSGMAFQMGAIILVGALIGQQLDEYYQLERPYLTGLFALLSIFAALYLSLKDLFTEEN